jgi:hypothetical protein
MDEDALITVSPRHAVRLSIEYVAFVKKAPRTDFVVRTLAKREAQGLPLMSAEIVIAGADTRERHPLAAEYPLHFRKTYFPGRLHGDPKHEYECQEEASRLIGVPPPIGYRHDVFRACLLPGPTYASLSPLQREPAENNVRPARELPLATAAGLWTLGEQAFTQLEALHAGGLAHGDAELHNFVVCATPLEVVVIDFEGAFRRDTLSEEDWNKRRDQDFEPLLRHAALLQCRLGAQPSRMGRLAQEGLDRMFKDPERLRRAIAQSADLEA